MGRPEPALDAAAFARAFPFHLQLDAGLRVVAAGASLRKACPALRVGRSLGELFAIGRPHGVDSIEDWREHFGELCTLTSRCERRLTLRGSAERGPGDSVLLLVTPVLHELDDMARLGLGFNDLAKHDAAGDTLLLAQATRLSGADAQRLSERLRARSEQLTAMIELSASGVAYFDEHGALQHLNTALLQMLGRERVSAFDLDIDACDAWIDTLLSPAERHRGVLRTLMNDASQAAEGLTLSFERPRRAMIRIAHARSQDGGAVFYLRDVTRETEVDRMKSEFLTTAAHELRTPMVSVFGFTELLLARPVPEAQRRDMLQTIHRQTSLLITMINELLDLARIEARQGKDLQCVPCRLGDLVTDAVAAYASGPGGARLQLQLPHAATEIHVDRDKTLRVLANVLSNAFKYSPAGGPVALSSRLGLLRGQPAVAVAVRDEGIGMSAAQLARVFERFYRADPSGNIPGTGLGMSLVREIIELHHGKVEVTSAPGEGTEVTLWWPVAPEQPPVAVPGPRRVAMMALP